MWTDIDYMDRRRVFTLDQVRFPLEKITEVVKYLHAHNQHYIVMVDPAISHSGKKTTVLSLRGHLDTNLFFSDRQRGLQPRK